MSKVLEGMKPCEGNLRSKEVNHVDNGGKNIPDKRNRLDAGANVVYSRRPSCLE